jgi:hypothetical protein
MAKLVEGFDPRKLETVSGASTKEFKFNSDSEPKFDEYMENVQEQADYIGEKWQQRIKKEGKLYYTCPICTGAKEKHFGKGGKKIVTDHIKKEHPMRVKELKMKKAPKKLSEPKEGIESPKRTLADAIHPRFRRQIEAQLAMQETLRPLREKAHQISTHGNVLTKLATMTESLAIQQVKGLHDKDLIGLVSLASNRGKRLLSRAARKECAQRGIDPNNTNREPSEKQMMVQEALRKSGSKVVIAHR